MTGISMSKELLGHQKSTGTFFNKNKEEKKKRKCLKKECDNAEIYLKEKQKRCNEERKLLKEKKEHISQSVDYCMRNPEALKFLGKEGKSGDSVTQTSDYDEITKQRREETTFIGAIGGLLLQGTFELHKRDRAMCDAEHEANMHRDTTFVQQKSCNTGSNCWGSEGVSHDFFSI